MPISSSRQPWPLWLRFALRVAMVSIGALTVSGAVEAMLKYEDATRQTRAAQGLMANAAAQQIDARLSTVLRAFGMVQALPWGQPAFDDHRRREELHRLMSLTPAVLEVEDRDRLGRTLLRVSRIDLDMATASPTQAGHRTPAADPVGYGPPYFSTNGSPQVRYTATRAGDGAGSTTLTLDLRFLEDVIASMNDDTHSNIYLADPRGLLIAHADPTVTLSQRQLTGLPLFAQALRLQPDGKTSSVFVDAVGLAGSPAMATAQRLASTGWLVLVEVPRSTALQPVFDTITRTLLLLLAASVGAALVSAAFARRMAAPIARLRQATADMAAGKLDQRLDVRTGDEIQGLAEDFNAMSERLQQSYRELEDKVAQRTAELALRRDEAERANAAKTRFLASASHDLRQPMHAIGLLVELLRARVQASDQRDLADKTHQAVQSMEALFGSLLDISKLDAGAVQPQPRPFALQALLDHVAATHAPLAQAKGLRLRVRPTPLHTVTDPELLERIVGNLVANAIRYTPAGGVLVACRRRGDGAVLQVVDSGVGIAADRLDLVFEEFVRLNDGAPGDKGLGLGLAIVRRTAQLLGLPVAVRSRPEHGSTFEVMLPAVSAPPAEVPASNAAGDTAPLAGAFVMLVDDDDVNLQASAALLRDWGCLVATAMNADAAVAEAARHLRSPDAIVTDLRLGRGDHGLALIRRLRAQAGQAVPALLVTADVQLPQPLDGDVQVLRKPCGPDRLRQALVQALAGTA